MHQPWRAVVALVLIFGCSTTHAQQVTTTAVAPTQASAAPVTVLTPSDAAGPLEGLVPATRVTTVCTTDEALCHPPDTVPDPLAGYNGRYVCRFATAGRVTPCCPDATGTLAQFWSGPDLAIADYIIGREGGCNPSIVNSVGCVGWWQMCGKSCPPNGCGDAWSSTVKARQLYDNRHWCDWYLAGDPVTGHACG